MIYDSQAAFSAQTAGGATQIVQLGTVELSDGEGVGVSRAVVTPPAGFTTVTGVATNNWTLNLRQFRAGSNLGTFATVTGIAGVNLVAETALVVPITGTPTFQQDDVLDAQLVQNGTGLAIGAGLAVEVDLS
jgi:hypothetical protein